SAHSYDGKTRSWNIANNALYIESIKKDVIPAEQERLTEIQQLNEYIMTSLRTSEGLDLAKIRSSWGSRATSAIASRVKPYEDTKKVVRNNEHLQLTKQGKLFADRIAADLFMDEG